VNRKQWIITGIIVTVLIAIGFTLWRMYRPDDIAETGESISILDLAYCAEEQVNPCVVSFSLDSDDNMLVNFLIPDLSFPNFYLKVTRDEGDVSYECQRVESAPNNAYCTGIKLPPGETLHLMLFSVKDDALLAEGDLSIIGLAFPNIEIALPTPTDASTETPSPTEPSSFNLPTPTQTQPAYPNPSYP
jgi:hypothetical protein